MKTKHLIILTCLLLLSGCADKVDCATAASMSPVGFWYGLWHGMIAGIAFIVSLFDSDVAIYASYNNGGWYNFGFLIGAGGILKGCSCSHSKK